MQHYALSNYAIAMSKMIMKLQFMCWDVFLVESTNQEGERQRDRATLGLSLQSRKICQGSHSELNRTFGW